MKKRSKNRKKNDIEPYMNDSNMTKLNNVQASRIEGMLTYNGDN